ncbi:MAG: glycosyltransferase family 9 protein, partial [Nevskiaceae bacterium]
WAPARRSSNVKYWPDARWAAVARGIRQALPQAAVIICGSSQETRLASSIEALAGEGVCSAAGELPLPRLLALQERAHSMVSVDTGPAHSAAALGCPLVMLFSSPDVSLYAPYWAASALSVLTPATPDSDPPLMSVEPGTVIEAWRNLRPR